MLADAKVATMDKNLAGMRVACLVVEKAVLRVDEMVASMVAS